METKEKRRRTKEKEQFKHKFKKNDTVDRVKSNIWIKLNAIDRNQTIIEFVIVWCEQHKKQ